MPRKIALVLNGASRDEAPFSDKSWEIWTLAWMVPILPRANLAFEIHTRDQWAKDETHYPKDEAATVAFMNKFELPVMMLEAQADIPLSQTFPRGEALLNLGWEVEHLASSASWMLSYAILLHAKGEVEEVGCWGMDMCATTEWAYQRPNANRLVGFLEGRGCKVRVPKGDKLLGIPFVYGHDSLQTSEGMTHALLFETFARLAEQTDLMFQAAYSYKEYEEKRMMREKGAMQ